ncbi:MAG: winged helix-turn-helix domain-containing protein [Proteobacteria bacterium]|nr:winged helix-turn-helix domain-containing protein [Pseudomonadota bacterium]
MSESHSDSSRGPVAVGRYEFGDFRIDLALRRLFRGDQERPLSPKAFDLLEALVRSVDQVVPKRTLLDDIWAGVRVEESVLKVRIAEIRSALDETAAAPARIHTHQRVGYRFAGPVQFVPSGGSGEPAPVVAFSQRPALAILPFNDFSASPGNDYFADGIVEELTTRLARFRYFPVIARNSTFVYKGQAVDVARASRELGARYVVEGSVQRSEDQARVIVQLIDGETGHHVWTDRFESDLANLFELNDEITDLIAGAMHSQLYAVEVRRATRHSAQNLDAWYCLLRAWSLQESLDPGENSAAKVHFLRALEFDPECAQAHSGLAMSHFRDVVHGWSASPVDSLRELRHNADRSLKCDAQDPYSHLATGVAHWLGGRRDDLLESIEYAIWLNPSLAWGYLWGGIAYGVAGDPERSLEMATRAIRLSPLDPLRGIFDYAVSIAHFAAGRYEEAYDTAKKAAGLMPDWGWTHSMLAASAGWLGRLDEARTAIEAAKRLLPGLTPPDLARLLPFAAPDFLERSVEGARRAGWRD